MSGHPSASRPSNAEASRGTPATAAARVAVVPVYNEVETVRTVLDGLEHAGFTSIIAVDDGSTDGSAGVLDAWASSSAVGRVIHLPDNQGKSAALRAARDHLRSEYGRGALDVGALVVNVDADGQHDLGYLDALIRRMEVLDADAMIARRDFGYHGWYKRLGNIVMSALGSLYAGRRLHDIESGYRVIRLGPLLHAQEFYEGHRYSECVEQAVVLNRLGYRVDNEFPVQVPVGRTRTRLSDAVNHVLRMSGAWYRTACWAEVPSALRSCPGAALALFVLLAFGWFLGTVLLHTIFLGNDSAQSYGHVWFIEHSLRTAHRIPLRMPALDSGEALTLPYAAIPWIPAAFLRMAVGDWAVTATMAAGVLLLLYGITRWLSRAASPLVMALVLVNWQLWNGVLQFQLPTVWAFAFAALSAAAFDRGRPAWGGALAWAALVAHPLMGGAGLASVTLAEVERRRGIPSARVAWLAGAALLASPAIWTFLQIPAVDHVSRWGWVTPARITLQRLSMLWWPWLCVRFLPVTIRWHVWFLAALGLLLARNFLGSNPQNIHWVTLPRFPDYVEAGRLDPAARYRVLTMSNQEDGMIQLMQAGATLTQDFFDESVARRSFGGVEEYRCFLGRKGADRVLVQGEWLRHPLRDTSNEVDVLDRLVAEGHAALTFRGKAGTLEYTVTSSPPAGCVRGE